MGLMNSFKWSFASELAAKAIQPVFFIVLARLLTPEDFGVMTAAIMVVAFSQVFWEAGLGKALIQRQNDIEEAANVSFFINILLGIIIAGVLCLYAQLIAQTFFQDSRVAAVLQVMSLQILFGALSSVHTALLTKAMDFRKLFWVRLATVSLPGFASIPLAWNGFGYWALVAGTLVGQGAQAVLLWRVSAWRPAWQFNCSVAIEMGRFGFWVGVSSMLAWFMLWADSLIIGKYLGANDLGIYRIGNQFSTLAFTMIFSPLMPVLYSHFSTMNKDKQLLAAAIQKIIRIIILTAIPSAVAIFCFSVQIGSALFGAKWEGVGFVLGVLALMHGFSWVVGMNGEVYRAYGRPSLETIVMAIAMFVYLVSYIYTIQIGFEVFVWNRLCLALGALLLHLYLLKAILGVKMMPILKYMGLTALLSFALVGAARWFAVSYVAGGWYQLVIGLLLSLLFVGSVIIVVERKGIVRDVFGLIRAG